MQNLIHKHRGYKRCLRFFDSVAVISEHKTNSNQYCLLPYTSQPYQQSGYIPLEAGKYYWIEALHKEGTRRDSLSVGYTLECPNAPSVLSEKPILRPSLQYKIPREWILTFWYFFGHKLSPSHQSL